jgi:hypothetical protein
MTVELMGLVIVHMIPESAVHSLCCDFGFVRPGPVRVANIIMNTYIFITWSRDVILIPKHGH